MTERQKYVTDEITRLALALSVDPSWALSIASQESSLGENQRSPTGAVGIFQMTRIAMIDLLQQMERKDDDLIDICCGLLFLRLLLQRWETIEEATGHYCDPNDRHFYVPSIMKKIREYDNP
jgi:membrane-bound lytic murein transglycosylase MltF